jgi:hypothetical protein
VKSSAAVPGIISNNGMMMMMMMMMTMMMMMLPLSLASLQAPKRL